MTSAGFAWRAGRNIALPLAGTLGVTGSPHSSSPMRSRTSAGCQTRLINYGSSIALCTSSPAIRTTTILERWRSPCFIRQRPKGSSSSHRSTVRSEIGRWEVRQKLWEEIQSSMRMAFGNCSRRGKFSVGRMRTASTLSRTMAITHRRKGEEEEVSIATRRAGSYLSSCKMS